MAIAEFRTHKKNCRRGQKLNHVVKLSSTAPYPRGHLDGCTSVFTFAYYNVGHTCQWLENPDIHRLHHEQKESFL